MSDTSWDRFWADERIFGLQGREDPGRRRTRVLVADEHLLYAEALIACIEEDERFEVIAHAGSGWEVLELAGGLLAAGLRPDIVLTSPDLPGLEPGDLTVRLRRMCPEAAVVMIVRSADASESRPAREAGASACVGSDSSVAQLLSTIAEVAEGANGRDSDRPIRRA
jgi:DNA-binding NarL/FixJ family response regulator